MHNTVVVIPNSLRVYQRRRDFLEIYFVVWDYIVVDNLHMFISIWTTLLVPETNNMADLMKDRMENKTRSAEGYSLLAISNPSNIRTATTGIEGEERFMK